MKIKNVALSVLSGILLAFSFPNFIENTAVVHTSFFMWFAFVPFFYIVYSENRLKPVFLYGLISGLVFYLVSLYWLWYVGPMGVFAYVAWAALCLYFAALFSVSVCAAVYLKNKYAVPLVISLAATLTFSEFIREWLFTGWPVLTPAQSQHQFIFILQLLKFAGVSGLNYMIYFVNLLITLLLLKNRDELRSKWMIVPAVVFAGLFAFTVAANTPMGGFEKDIFRCVVLQADIDQNVKWDKKYVESTASVFKGMITELSATKPGLYVWPETGFPGQLNMEPAARKELAKWSKGAFNLAGSDNADYSLTPPNYYNSVFLLDPAGKIRGTYSKFHLVPFGEYIPFQDVFPFVRKVVQRYGFYGFTSGRELKPLELTKDLSCGAMICYDSFFPEIPREFARHGAGFLAHLSYETWYGVSPASAQIFTNAVLRAVENDLYLVRCVASGISGVVDNRGNIIRSSKLFAREAFPADIKVKRQTGHALTFYTRFGDWFPWFALLTLAWPLIAGRKKQ